MVDRDAVLFRIEAHFPNAHAGNVSIEQFLTAIDFDFHQVEIRFPLFPGIPELRVVDCQCKLDRRLSFGGESRFNSTAWDFPPSGCFRGAFDGQFPGLRRLRT